MPRDNRKPRKFRKLLLLLLLLGGLSLIRFDIPADELKQKYTGKTSGFVDIHKVLVHYQDKGKGPVLLLLHGVSASSFAWTDWMNILSKDFRVIAPDLPGGGLTGPVSQFDYRVNSYVEFLEEFRKKLGIEKFHLAGNSLGGGIAWHYALTYPERVEKLILTGSIGFPQEDSFLNSLSESWLLGKLMCYVTPEFGVRLTMEMIYADPTRIKTEELERHHQLMLRKGNRDAVFIRLQNQRENLHPERLPELKQPTLLLWGKQDNSVPITHAREFHKRIPNSLLRIYPNAGHVLMQELPVQSANDVRVFLQK